MNTIAIVFAIFNFAFASFNMYMAHKNYRIAQFYVSRAHCMICRQGEGNDCIHFEAK